jgi:hypothetical protein
VTRASTETPSEISDPQTSDARRRDLHVPIRRARKSNGTHVADDRSCEADCVYSLQLARFEYDAFGSRARKSIEDAGTVTSDVVYVCSLYQRLRNGTSVVDVATVEGPGGIVAEVQFPPVGGSETRYFLNDLHGNPDVVTSAAGTVVERIKFDPFGERRNPSHFAQRLSATRTGARIDYTGHEFDDELGLTPPRRA